MRTLPINAMPDIFVFGSNLLGIHGAGAAKHAVKHFGAVMGVGVGRRGNSYAIPTKETPYRTLSLNDIQPYVTEFLDYAKKRYWEAFFVTKIGCGLAGYCPEDIAPMFKGAPDNVNLPEEFKQILGKGAINATTH